MADKTFFVGYVMPDFNRLVEFTSAEKAEDIAEEWVAIRANTLAEAMAVYDEKFLEWQSNQL